LELVGGSHSENRREDVNFIMKDRVSINCHAVHSVMLAVIGSEECAFMYWWVSVTEKDRFLVR